MKTAYNDKVIKSIAKDRGIRSKTITRVKAHFSVIDSSGEHTYIIYYKSRGSSKKMTIGETEYKTKEREFISREKRKNNKILNNSYFHGDKLKGDDYEMSASIKVSGEHSNVHLSDSHAPDEYLMKSKIQEEVLRLLTTEDNLKNMLKDNNKKKFNKKNVNAIFKLIYDSFANDMKKRMFLNIIDIFDSVSNITGLKYKNLFDLLDFEYKEMLLDDLNEKHNILGNYSNFNKIF